ncbi:bacteriocin-type signal sequence [Enterococcus faecalis ATCC 35038]|uniref:lactococcin G-beta family bacteriocin n=1 Tax=Enterococcus faecalis TaxID=1351 RepID=UPI00032D95D8|nr:lactococcin G-beta family bacteriocin [Enterococcus faecalis]EGO7954075.1 lactococcin G-beta/enterocin 1071B family bacteriocin [Enterococcus faecalis]EOJ52763.1 bacteriocin-type signal sequence [Enterococcus faecalis ATCC 35038]PLA94850.1 bacteriocin [Enterococcus faecalis]RXN39822.1 bacteriocin [Enterococcus faecalis]RXN52012.1 bacteriocin [Enterococcus faecalis]
MKNINNSKNMKIIRDNELKKIIGGGPGKLLPWIQPVYDFVTGLTNGIRKEGNRNKWKNV